MVEWQDFYKIENNVNKKYDFATEKSLSISASALID